MPQQIKGSSPGAHTLKGSTGMGHPQDPPFQAFFSSGDPPFQAFLQLHIKIPLTFFEKWHSQANFFFSNCGFQQTHFSKICSQDSSLKKKKKNWHSQANFFFFFQFWLPTHTF